MRVAKAGALGLVLALVSSVPALAGILTVNYSGYLTSSGICHTCVSPSNTSYADGAAPWTGTFTLDTSHGTMFIGGYYTTIQGGKSSAATTDFGSSVITGLNTSVGPVNFGIGDSLGHDYSLFTISNLPAGNRQFYLYYQTRDDSLFTTYTVPVTRPVGLQDVLILSVSNPGIPDDLNGTFSLFDPAGIGTISFFDESYNLGDCTYCYDSFSYQGKITGITVSEAAAAIPEPLTISSFAVGLMGIAGARRKARAAASK